MNSIGAEPIILSGRQFETLAGSLKRPDEGYMDRRDAIFKKTDENVIMKRTGTDIEVEIPDLDLSFIGREKA